MEETLQIISGQLKKFKQMKKQNLNINNPLDCFLINNDMITEICNKHNSILNSDNKQFNNNKINNKSINIGLLLTENLKINDIDYPCNFFIIEKENLEQFVHDNNLLNEFKLYKVLIGESGIFILNEEMHKDRYIVYYIYDMDFNDCKIDKIFIFKKKAEFKKEIELLNNKGRDYYFNSRNIINDKTGYYNLIDDGKIIGKYINLKRIDKFKIKSNNKKEDNNNKNNGDNNNYKNKDNNEDYKEKKGDNNGNNNENKNGNNNMVNNEDDNEYIEEDGVQKKNENYAKNKEIIKLFLPHLLICLTKIDLLKSYLIPKIKRNPNISKYKIMQLFSKILEKNNKNEMFESDNNELIDNFIEEFFMQNLHEKLYFDKDNILSNYENMIKILINKLREDFSGLFVNSNQEILSFFDNLFYGKKTVLNNTFEVVDFNTLYIDPVDYCGNETQISLDNIINDFKFKEKEKIISFPKIMIIIAFNQYENFLTIPLNLNIKEIKINYNLICGISSEEQNLVSFIKNDGNIFLKTYFDFEKKTVKCKPLENKNELNNCFIYFYEKENDKSEECDYYSINSKNNDFLNKKYTGKISNIESNNNAFNNNNLNFMNNNDNYNNNYFNNFNNNNNYNINNKNLNYMNNNNNDLNDMNNNAMNNMNYNNLILNNKNNNNNFVFIYMNINNNNLNYTNNNFVLNNNNQNNIYYMNNNSIPNNNYTNNNNLNLYYMNNNFNNMNNNDLSLNPNKYNCNSMGCISSSNSNNFNLNNMGGSEGNSKCNNNICNSMSNIKSNSNYNINTFNNNNYAKNNFKTNN